MTKCCEDTPLQRIINNPDVFISFFCRMTNMVVVLQILEYLPGKVLYNKARFLCQGFSVIFHFLHTESDKVKFTTFCNFEYFENNLRC